MKITTGTGMGKKSQVFVSLLCMIKVDLFYAWDRGEGLVSVDNVRSQDHMDNTLPVHVHCACPHALPAAGLADLPRARMFYLLQVWLTYLSG